MRIFLERDSVPSEIEMKVFDRVKQKVKRYLTKKQTPVIVIPRRDPWEGEKWVRVHANNPYKKILMQRE